jgi:sulfur-carrier protein
LTGVPDEEERTTIMPTKVRIPAPLRKLTKDQAVVEVPGGNIEEVLANLEKAYPGIRERICDEAGQIRRFINVFVNGEDIRFKEGAKTAVSDGAEVSIIPAIAGGRVPASAGSRG